MEIPYFYLITAILAHLGSGEHHDPTVELSDTIIRGSLAYLNYSDSYCEQFLGIPFAKAPTGELRFKPTEDLHDLPRSIDATKYSPGCMAKFGLFNSDTTEFSEDCLYLNIWRKRGTTENDKKAVICIIFAGGYTAGDSSEIDWRGLQLADWGDVVVVNFNYRLGIFGFLDLGLPGAEGNMGHLDQQSAMRWIQRNIHSFGGDPTRVTLFGTSSGSMSISAHLMSSGSKGLFHAAVMDAAVLTSGHAEPTERSKERGRRIAEKTCSEVKDSTNTEEVLSCLRNTSAEKLVQLQEEFGVSKTYTFRPTYYSKFLPQAPEQMVNHYTKDMNKVTIMIGNSQNEGSLFLTDGPQDPLPVLTNVSETLDWDHKLAGYQAVQDEYIKNKVIEAYNLIDGRGVDFYVNSSAYFIGDGIFTCPVNNMVHHYSTVSQVYAYHWTRRTVATVEGIDPQVFGAYQGSPFYHMVGSEFAFFGKDIPVADADYARASLNMLAKFARTLEQPSFGGRHLPLYKKATPEVFVFADQPDAKKGTPRNKQCNDVWPFYENY